jgi:hypothetical protein
MSIGGAFFQGISLRIIVAGRALVNPSAAVSWQASIADAKLLETPFNPVKKVNGRSMASPKKLRPAFGGRLAAREPVWDGEGWGCDRVAGS